MDITETCIRRPVFSTVLTLMVVVLGLVCQSRLPVRKDPAIEKSVISVESEFTGASPKVVEAQITKILEGQFSTIPGADLITSTSSNEKSEIRIEFSPDRNVDGAAADVRDRLALVRNHLPRGIPEPIIRKSSSDSTAGFILAFTSDKKSVDDLHDYIDRYVKSRFEVIPGVGRTIINGGNIKAMRIFLDPQKLAAYGYTPMDVVEAIPTQHVQIPCGRLISQDREYMLTVNGELTRPEEFDEIVLPSRGKEKVVRIKDVGKSMLVPDDIREGSWFNGRECVTLSITKQSTANPIDISAGVRKILPEVQEMLQSGTDMVVAIDEAKEINASMNNVYRAIFESAFLVILVVFLFLWSFRATLIPLVTIPVSLLGTFALLYAFDFSINTFTMLAMVLAVGLVVDDAIVVLENIHRHIEGGLSKMKAAIVGSKEIFFSIIAMTLTLATAYIPIALTPGKIGKYFKEFALTLSGAVLISGFIAVTLSPMMCSKLLRVGKRKVSSDFWAKAGAMQEKCIASIENWYSSSLRTALSHQIILFSIAVVVSIIGIIAARTIPSENKPAEDTGIISFVGNGPTGASYEFMKKNAQMVDNIISKTPYLHNRWLKADTNQIEGWVEVVDWGKRELNTKQIAEIISPQLRKVIGVPCSASAGRSSSDKATVDFVLQTNQNLEYLEKFGGRFMQSLYQNYKGIEHIRSTLLTPQQEYVIDINRDKAASLGVSVDDIVSTISYFVRGKKASNVQREAKRDELFVQMESSLRQTPEDLSRMLVRSKLQTPDNEPKMVSISDLITIRERISPMSVNHYNQMISILGFADIANGYTLGTVLEDLEKLKTKFLPDTIHMTFSGATKNYLEESRQIVFVFLLALIFVFLVLAAQFESFIDPFIIMLSVPFSLTGAVVTLWLIPDCTLNIYSKVGLVTLIGLITKHGILIVDFANTLREKGKDAFEAAQEAAHLRLRPILMTTFAMVIGSVPLALATGAGAASRRQIGWAIVGGMSFGTLFTLFIVPMMYIIFSRFKSFKTSEEE